VVLSAFPIDRVMDQIAASGSTTGQTGLDVFQQLFDTLNDGAHAATDGPHCDDVLTNGVASIDGFPIECPRQEGVLATRNVFTPGDPDSFAPIGLVNRFDLAPADGSNCGEYRIVFGKISGRATRFDRALVIFEAKLPNASPELGIAGCLPVAQFWAGLSAVTDPRELASRLAGFYFDGLPDDGFSAVVDAANYGVGGGPDTGQIRANLFMNVVSGQKWELREFHLRERCGFFDCTLVAANVAVQNNPFGGLFAGSDLRSSRFQEEFVEQVPTLAATTIPGIAMTTRRSFNAGESREQDQTNDYTAQAASNRTLAGAVQQKLAAIGRTDLTPQNVFDRATTQSCAGCHQVATNRALGGGLTWPATNFFTQIDENSKLSPALTNAFLPFRAQVLTAFIDSASGCGSGNGPADAGGGGRSDGGYARAAGTFSGRMQGSAN
jgi:hypothetical protein